ncbi:MAG: aminotransferase DegT [Syntrophus sp. (in: bacteria)]|nr:aminotransferase DegT [Syntrophus sp. (in: bacteria)]
MFENIIKFIRQLYGSNGTIPLHEPRFIGNEKKYLNQCIDSTYVSYVGEFVTRFEDIIKEYTGAKYAIATANGTLALHAALLLAGVKNNDEVLTQALTFVATANAITYCGAKPIFIDSDRETLGMSPVKLEEFLKNETIIKDDGFCYNKQTGNKISACVPVHIFGHPVKIEHIKSICGKYNITLVEDAAESLGSFYKEKHTGIFGKIGILSFNGNKLITTGGGGMIITDDENIARQAKHITTTAKVSHKWEFFHDEVGYNYRMPNVNAAIGCAQMESLPKYLDNKRETAALYKVFFNELGISFLVEPEGCGSNYWLNAIILKDRVQRDEFLEYCNNNRVMSRPIWTLMNKLPMYQHCQHINLENAQWLEDRVVNIPSSVRV